VTIGEKRKTEMQMQQEVDKKRFSRIDPAPKLGDPSP